MQNRRRRANSMISLGILSLLFCAFFAFAANQGTTVTCDGQAMTYNMVCDHYTNGTRTGTYTYTEQANYQADGRKNDQTFAIIAGVVGGLLVLGGLSQ